MGILRVSWGMSAAVWGVVLVMCCVWWGWSAALIAVIFALLPDLTLIGAFSQRGRMRPSRVALYNALHTMLVPVGVLAIGIVVFLVTGGFERGIWGVGIAGLAWFVHIAADRAFGFGLRAPDGTVQPVG